MVDLVLRLLRTILRYVFHKYLEQKTQTNFKLLWSFVSLKFGVQEMYLYGKAIENSFNNMHGVQNCLILTGS